MSASAANLKLIQTVARRLGALRERVVFLGGATTTLLVTDAGATSVRATQDVDVIVEVGSYSEYQHRLGTALERAGFAVDTTEGAPLCRWVVEGVKVDIMPTDTAVLEFSNRWYPSAIDSAVDHAVGNGLVIRVISASLFLATKLEAFNGRGGGDFVASHDLEEVITIVDGRTTLVDEVLAAAPPLSAYIADEFGRLLDNEAFIDALPGHLPGDPASQARVPLVEARLHRLAGRGDDRSRQ